MTEKKTSRQIQAENTRARIMDVILRLLAEKTYDELSIQEICREAEISIGTFYHHFPSKSNIVVELYRNCDKYFSEEVISKVTTEEPTEAILHYLELQCKYALDTGKDLVKNVYKAQIDNGNFFFLSNDRALPAGLRSLIIKGVAASALKADTDAERLTSELLIISRGVIYNWCVSDGQIDMLEHVRRLANNYLTAYVNSKTSGCRKQRD